MHVASVLKRANVAHHPGQRVPTSARYEIEAKQNFKPGLDCRRWRPVRRPMRYLHHLRQIRGDAEEGVDELPVTARVVFGDPPDLALANGMRCIAVLNRALRDPAR
jgi:hypothetical protein